MAGSRFMFGAVIALASTLIAMALTTGWTIGPFWHPLIAFEHEYVYRSEDPALFWMMVSGWAAALVVALGTVIRLARSGLL